MIENASKLNFYETKFSAIIKQLSSPLEPLATGETAKLPNFYNIRAVVFDVYGTLLISASGDISLASEGSRGKAALESLAEADMPIENNRDGEIIVELLHAAIAEQHRTSGSKTPEVEIRECWSRVLESLSIEATMAQIEEISVEYECRVNPIWPMPSLNEVLVGLKANGIELGIVSNAQFFTPLAFKPLTGNSLQEWGFNNSLNIWSYEHREAKPGIFLYELCAKRLAKIEISPQEVLYVGNDLRNDVWPANQVGFKTVLFAGDARSLRWRSNDPTVEGVEPDAVITDLSQLSQLIT